MEPRFRLFPEQASTNASAVDMLYLFQLSVGVFFTALICIMILFYSVRYRRGAQRDRSNPPEGNIPLEILWTVIPLGLVMTMFAWGANLFFTIYRVPSDAAEIYVVGKQWMWKIQHPEGKSEINELHIPVGRPVKLKMISEDVIHSFFVPEFRVKMDVLPGRYSTMWFEPTRTGRFHLFCTEYCGTGHSQMIGRVVVMEPAEYSNWLSGAVNEPAQVTGQSLFEQYRCNTCHRDTADARCPTVRGLFGKEVKLADGSTVVADEHYLRESILDPNAKIVAGYQPLMPTFKGQINEQGILQIIAYIESLSERAAAEPSGAETNP
jgi:cytochrome c oxidase subunit 2